MAADSVASTEPISIGPDDDSCPVHSLVCFGHNELDETDEPDELDGPDEPDELDGPDEPDEHDGPPQPD